MIARVNNDTGVSGKLNVKSEQDIINNIESVKKFERNQDFPIETDRFVLSTLHRGWLTAL